MKTRKVKQALPGIGGTKDAIRNRLYQRKFYLKNRLQAVQAGAVNRQGYTVEQIQSELDKTVKNIQKYRGLGPGRPAKKTAAK